MRVGNGLVHPLGTWLARGLLPGHGLFPVAAAAGATPQKVTRCWHLKILKPYFFTPYTTKMTFNFRVLTWKLYHFNAFKVLFFGVGVSTPCFFHTFCTLKILKVSNTAKKKRLRQEARTAKPITCFQGPPASRDGSRKPGRVPEAGTGPGSRDFFFRDTFF